MKLTLDLKKTDFQTLFAARKYIFLAGGIAVVAVGMLLFGVIGQVGGISDLVTANKTEQVTNQALQTKVKALQQVSYTTEFAKSAQINLALPSAKPLLQLITGVNNVAQQANVSLSDVTTSPGKLASQSGKIITTTTGNSSSILDTVSTVHGVNILTIGLKAHGSLTEINTFLDLIEKITPITQVTKLSLNVAAPNAPAVSTSSTSAAVVDQSQFDADLELSSYYFSQAITVSVDSPLPTIGAKDETFLTNLSNFQFPDYQSQQQIQGGGSTDLFGTGTTP